jgi:hypothetical protein
MFDQSPPQKVRLQYFFDRANYSVGPGGVVAVTVFLRETFNPSTGSSLLAPGTDGLISGAVLIQVGYPIPTRPAQVKTTSAITGNPGFDFAIIPQLPVPTFANSAGIVELSANPVFGEVGSRSATCETVLLALATFTYTAGPVPGEVTYLTAMNTEVNPRMPGETIVTASGVALDSLLQPASATITVSPKAARAHSVREEESLTGVSGLAGRVWWQRRN